MYRPFLIKALCVRHFLSLLVVIALGMTLPGGVGGCGGAVSNGEEESGAPTIASITGDGAASGGFEDSLIISGENFIEGMTVGLQGTDNDMDFDLGYTLDSSTQITANLPSALTEGSYDLVITSAAGAATSAVTILRGETGATGAGLTIEAQFLCGPSGELDPTNDDRAGLITRVTKFTDGSYYISCMADFLDGDFLFVDTSSDSLWYASNSAGVTSGVINCVPLYVTAFYSISGNTVTYQNQADTSQTQTVACTQTYP